ncbi:translocation/assembly module TamB domain-containing protein [Deminuibacter soli]|uniref:Translocation/assembly module TamB n=1 Tax=Deminuibacter soli TaxID=2291815 RepID=A0A3E1NF10_9BACT|nr:translocation/assembly module TamB [Deminuibacter soli]RFM26566.1 translocation/assembly module TamB [Deminuibacter soli]
MKLFLRRFIKVVLWTIAGIFFIVILAVILIQLPSVQNFAKNKAVAYLEKKLKTKVSIGRLAINFPKRIVLEHIYLEDQHRDTLLSGDTLRVDIALLKLLKKQVVVSYVELVNIKANVRRIQPDTTFNYEFITKAFSGDSDTATAPADTSSGMQFKLGTVRLKRISASYQDDATGNEFHLYLGDFRTQINEFDPTHMVVSIPGIHLADVSTRIRTYKPTLKVAPVPVDTTNTGPIQASIRLDTIMLQRLKVQYDDEIAAMHSVVNMQLFNVFTDKIDLAHTAISLKRIDLEETHAAVTLDKQQKPLIVKKVEHVADSVQQLNWRFTLAALNLKNNSLAYDDNNMPQLKKGMDYSHMNITSINVNASALSFTPVEYKGKIDQLGFAEKSGFVLQRAGTEFLYNQHEAQLRNLVVQTPHSQLHNQLLLKYPSVESISKKPGEVYVDMLIDSTNIAVNDVVTAVPMLNAQLGKYRNSTIHFAGNAKGYVKDIHIGNLEFSGIGSTALQMQGSMKGLPDAKTAYYDIQLKKATTTSADIVNLAPPKSLPSTFRIPETMSATGYFKGTMKSFLANLNARTSRGNIAVKGSLKNNGAAYTAQLTADKVNVGYLMKQEKNVGIVSLSADVNGAGTNYKTMTATMHAKLAEAAVRGYNYHGLTMQGNIKQGLAQLQAAMTDPNLHFALQSTADTKVGKFPAVQLQLTLDTANFNALHLVKDTMTLHGKIDADFANTNPDTLQGRLTIKDLVFVHDSVLLKTDSLLLAAHHSQDSQYVAISAEMGRLDLAGKYKLTELGTALQHTIHQYYGIPGFKDTAFTPQNWRLNMLLQTSPLVLQFMPQLKGTDTIGAHIDYASSDNLLKLDMAAPKIQYGEQVIQNTHVFAVTEPKQLTYGLTLQKAGSKSFYVNQTALNGRIADSTIYATLHLQDKNNKERYALGVQLKQLGDSLRLAFDKDSLRLNYEPWTVSPDNAIIYDTTGIIVHNFALSKGGQEFAINSPQGTTASPIDVSFKDFNIKTLTSFAEQDSLLVDGVINGKAEIKDVMKNPVFTSDLAINNLSYKKDTLGNAVIKVNNEQANTYAANVGLTGNNTDIQLDGKYYTGESRMDMQLAIKRMNLAIAKAFAAGQLKDIGGNLTGNIAMAGTLQKPDINGNLQFHDAFIQPTMLGEKFRLTNERIDVNSNGIEFNAFTLADSANNKAVLDGTIGFADFTNPTFDLILRATNFRLVNATKKDNPMFYGKLNMDVGIDVTGSMNAPEIDARLKANKQTDFTFVLPSENPEVVSREGIVHFIDPTAKRDSAQNAADTLALQPITALSGMDVNATIETDSTAKFTLVIDELNGDALKISGKADLAASMDESGKMSLTGDYRLHDGSYQVTLSVLKKKFTVQNGSTITWTGDPMQANIDITGVYSIEAQPIDLVEDQLAGRSGADVNRFKQRLPFQVLLKMKGELLKPIISFDIALPEEQQNQYKEVETKLEQLRTDESEMNKQVFALLLLGRFVQQDPLQSATASTSTDTRIRQSVSNILTDQLNQLAGSLIKGVDLNFGLNSEDDYTTGQRETKTDLTVGVSKSLLSDRLKVSVGSNFELEGPAAEQQQNAANIAGDIAIDYQLTKNGRYMIRGYRRNKYDAVVEGQVVETGLTFIFTLDYDRFWELFQSKKKYWENRRKKRAPQNPPSNPNNTSGTGKQADSGK